MFLLRYDIISTVFYSTSSSIAYSSDSPMVNIRENIILEQWIMRQIIVEK